MNFKNCTMTLVVAAAMLVLGNPVAAQDYGGQELEFSLFQNFYTPDGASAATAAMYPAPHPVPYWVGSSMYTYQPLYPHQHLYHHKKTYYNYYAPSQAFYSDNLKYGRGGDALNKTTVIWKSTGYHFGHLPFSSFAAQRFTYNLASYKYGLNGDRGLVGHGYGCAGKGCHGGGHFGGHHGGCHGGECYGGGGDCHGGNCGGY